jgi:hypothetical protein
MQGAKRFQTRQWPFFWNGHSQEIPACPNACTLTGRHPTAFLAALGQSYWFRNGIFFQQALWQKNNLFWATARKFEGKKIALPFNHILPNRRRGALAKGLKGLGSQFGYVAWWQGTAGWPSGSGPDFC